MGFFLCLLRMLNFDALLQICAALKYRLKLENPYVNDSIYDTIEGMAPDLDYVMNECRWQGKQYNCSELFVPIITKWGLCFTFNALNSHDFYTNA